MPSGSTDSLLQQLRGVLLPPDSGDRTDGELLAAYIAQRHEAAFAALVRRHGSMVLGVCRRLLRSMDDVEDVFQATFLVLARKARDVRPPEAVGNWLYGVAYRTALEAAPALARRLARERQVAVMPELSVEPVESSAELRTVLDQELSRLPDKQRLPVILCDLEGRTRKDVARQLKLPEATLSNRISAARQLLARRLTRRGYALSAGGLAAILTPEALTAAPAALVASTAHAAVMISAGPIAVDGLISTGAILLLKRELQAMFWTKLKKVAAVLLTLGILGGGITVLLQQENVARLAGADAADGAKPAGPAAKPEATPLDSDMKRMQGVWQVIAWVEGGVPVPEGRYKDVNMRIVVANSTLSIKTTTPDGRDVGPEMAFVLHEKASPKTIDTTRDGQTIFGIYAFDKDTLKLCVDLDGTNRPASFETQRGTQQRSYVLKKQTKKAPPRGLDKEEAKPLPEISQDAEKLLEWSLRQAKATNRRVLLIACTKSCLPCRQLDELFAELKPILDKHVVVAKLDLRDMKNADDVHRRFRKGVDDGPNYMPWMVILDESARTLAISGKLITKDSVIGLPHGGDADRRYFLNMLRTACPGVTESELKHIDVAAKRLHDKIWAKVN